MNFKESIDYLFGLGYERSVKKFGLENTYTLLEALGNPQNNFIKVQVAGTNGKGSTCAFLESVLVQAGIKVGVNTSPHLVSVTERIRVNGIEITEEKFAECVTKVRKIGEKLLRTGKLGGMPTFFEHLTAIAQMVFADEKVEVAILEVGLGGRFDATTATEAEIVAITPIDLDHTKTLGDTIEKIAAEKSAIIREDVEVVIANQNDQAMRVVLAKCEEMKVYPRFARDVSIGRDSGENAQPPRPADTPPLKGGELEMSDGVSTGSANDRRVDKEDSLVFAKPDTVKQKGGNATFRKHVDSVNFQTKTNLYKHIHLGLEGKHQVENAATAILLAETLQEKGFNIANEQIVSGLERAVHKGRLEYHDGILFDGAHNVAGAQALKEFIVEAIDQPITMIFAAMGGKNLGEIGQILFPLAEHLILTTPENPRAMDAKDIAAFVTGSFEIENVFVIDVVSAALKKAKDLSGERNLILVTGSLYLIGEIQAVMQKRKVERRRKKKV